MPRGASLHLAAHKLGVGTIAAQPERGHLAASCAPRHSPHSPRHAAQRDGPTAPLAEPGVRAEQYSGRNDRREHLPWCGVKGKGTGCAGAGAARVRGAVEDEGEDQGEG